MTAGSFFIFQLSSPLFAYPKRAIHVANSTCTVTTGHSLHCTVLSNSSVTHPGATTKS